MRYKIAAFYHFTPLSNPAALRETLLAAFAPLQLCGTLLLAPEGLNGTLAGSEASIEALLTLLHTHTGLPPDTAKFSHADVQPFNKLKLRLKREIITFNQPAADPNIQVGTYVKPQDWNALLEDPDVILLDTRNRYETAIGSFESARDPGIDNFTDFAAYVRSRFAPEERHKKIAMFCTGGIRCEKASSFMLSEGFAEVYHLQGGILKYLEEILPEDSKWQGACYVFDRRIAVEHGLKIGDFSQCDCCGYPIPAAQDGCRNCIQGGAVSQPPPSAL